MFFLKFVNLIFLKINAKKTTSFEDAVFVLVIVNIYSWVRIICRV